MVRSVQCRALTYYVQRMIDGKILQILHMQFDVPDSDLYQGLLEWMIVDSRRPFRELGCWRPATLAGNLSQGHTYGV